MDQVSSFFEGILTVEPDSKEDEPSPDPGNLAGSYSDSLINNAINYRTFKNFSGEKWAPDLDFSSFWNSSKTTEDGSGVPVPVGLKPTNSSILVDKLVEKIISMIIPLAVEGEQSSRILKERIEMQKSRPALSMNIMSTNSVQFNQRLSSVFYLLDNVIMLFNWTSPTFTIGMLLVLTHLILNPYLLSTLPVFLLLKNVLVPHYMVIYSPDPTLVPDSFDYNPIPSNVKIDSYKVPKPIPQLSREFLLNMTDLQNHMVPYIVMYDFVVWLTEDYLYFKNEQITSIIYLGLLLAGINNLLLAPKLFAFFVKYFNAFKIVGIVQIWVFVIMAHPHFRGKILEWMYKEDTRLGVLHFTDNIEQKVLKILIDSGKLELEQSPSDFNKEVEIFELQKLNKKTKIWELIGFTDNFYSINVSSRKFNSMIKTKFANQKGAEGDPEVVGMFDGDVANSTLEDYETTKENNELRGYIKLTKKKSLKDVKAPRYWEFSDAQWRLDLDVQDWVQRNLIKDLVIIDDDEKWVYDYQEEETEDGGDEKKKGVLSDFYRRRRWIRHCRREGKETPERKGSSSL